MSKKLLFFVIYLFILIIIGALTGYGAWYFVFGRTGDASIDVLGCVTTFMGFGYIFWHNTITFDE